MRVAVSLRGLEVLFGQSPADDGSSEVTIHLGADDIDNGGADHCDDNNRDDNDDTHMRGDCNCNPVEAADRDYADDCGDDECNKRPPTRSKSFVGMLLTHKAPANEVVGDLEGRTGGSGFD